jgi:hypothetical protein
MNALILWGDMKGGGQFLDHQVKTLILNTIENDTPEKTTDNSNPLLHIAQQERSFSDENMAASTVTTDLPLLPVHDAMKVEST